MAGGAGNGRNVNIPFRNMRQLLSLQAKVAPDKVFLTTIGAEGEREELTYAEFNARAHQAANLLHTDFGVQAGDVVAIIDDHPSDVAVLLMACWLIGAVALPYHAHIPNETIVDHLWTSGVSICLIRDDFIDFWKEESGDFWTEEAEKTSRPLVIIELGGFPSSITYPSFEKLVRSFPTTFLTDEPEPLLDSPALSIVMLDKPFTQRHLLVAAQSLASMQAITGNHRLLSYLPVDENSITQYLTALMTGAAITFAEGLYGKVDIWWRIVAAERLHLTDKSIFALKELCEIAYGHRNAGTSIYGEGIYQQDIKQLRHIICDVGLIDGEKGKAMMRDFTNLFGIMALTGFITLGVPGFCTLMPIDLTWPEYRHWMFEHDGLCVGCPLDGYEIGIMDGGGNMLKAGERGKLCVGGNVVEVPRYKRELDGWLHTHQNAYYLTDERGRQFVYLLDNSSPIS